LEFHAGIRSKPESDVTPSNASHLDLETGFRQSKSWKMSLNRVG
jgi:hypothetical protein